jgi:hypothetical protein
VNLAELKGGAVVFACAISAGVHGALVPDHFAESIGAGLGFVAATVLLASLTVWLTWRPAARSALGAAAAVLLGLLASYALTMTTGLPVLHPDPEPLDGLALTTKAVEIVGLLAATSLLWSPVPLPSGSRKEIST